MGSTFLYEHKLTIDYLLPATSIGLFSVAVLNLNNIRDITSDKIAGKRSIPVRIGRKKAVIYHWGLLLGGFSSTLIYVLINFSSPIQLLFTLVLPLLIINGKAVKTKSQPMELDPYLKQMTLTTLSFVLLFGIGQTLN